MAKIPEPRTCWQAAWWRFKVALGFGSVRDGSICWRAPHVPHWRDPHDYPIEKGGDGLPCHVHIYCCWRCGREFTI